VLSHRKVLSIPSASGFQPFCAFKLVPLHTLALFIAFALRKYHLHYVLSYHVNREAKSCRLKQAHLRFRSKFTQRFDISQGLFNHAGYKLHDP
jgi:hypothetical protein